MIVKNGKGEAWKRKEMYEVPVSIKSQAPVGIWKIWKIKNDKLMTQPNDQEKKDTK